MTEPTPIKRRRVDGRPKRVKLAAVMAADLVGVVEASKQTGIPHQTISYWMDRPEFGEIRRKTREDLAEEVKVATHTAWARVVELAPTMEARDAIFAAEKGATIMQLLSGEATSRTETKDLTNTLDDHEREALRRVLDEVTSAMEVT